MTDEVEQQPEARCWQCDTRLTRDNGTNYCSLNCEEADYYESHAE